MPIIRIKENNPLVIEVLRAPNSPVEETFVAKGQYQIGSRIKVRKQDKRTHQNPTEVGEKNFDKDDEEVVVDLR